MKDALRAPAPRDPGRRTDMGRPAEAVAAGLPIARQAHAILRDPGVDASGKETRPWEREDRREPAEPADATEQLGHGIGTRERTPVGHHELHRRHARLARDLGEAGALRC